PAAGEDARELVGATVAGPEGEPGGGSASEARSQTRARRDQSGAQRADCGDRVPSTRGRGVWAPVAADRGTPGGAESSDRAPSVRAGVIEAWQYRVACEQCGEQTAGAYPAGLE